jgi:hypothetical protein
MLATCAALGVYPAQAQDAVPATAAANEARPSETADEVIVRGKRLAEFRVEVQLARERAYAIFNEINSTDDFDVTCREEMRTGTRLERTVCAARFEGRVSRRAAQDYLATMRWICSGTADCLFDPGYAGYGKAAAMATESEAPMQRARLNEEIHRLASTDVRFGQAILDFYEASLKYHEERKALRSREGNR